MNENSAYIIAEIGSNHNGDMDLCRRMIDAAKEAGADAAKFQSFSDKSLISEAEYARRMDYGDSEADKKRHFGTLKEMVASYWMRPEQHEEIATYCRKVGIEFLSTPFSPGEADMLDKIGVPMFKIASMDVNHPELLKHVARKKKPVLLSTGMASLGEIEAALETLEVNGNGDVTILHCTSVYPPKPEYLNMRNISMFREAFEHPVGFSDHTIGTDAPLIALSLGASVIEKHFTTDKDLPGWDHWVSADPAELARIVEYARMPIEERQEHARKIENYEILMGRKRRVLSHAELDKRIVMRRCVVAKTALKAGHVLTLNDIDFKRPGSGIHPDEIKYILGRKLKVDVPYDHEFCWSDFGSLA